MTSPTDDAHLEETGAPDAPVNETRREYRARMNRPRFIYVVKRGDTYEAEDARPAGRLILPWETESADSDAPRPLVPAPVEEFGQQVEAVELPEGDWTVVPYQGADTPSEGVQDTPSDASAEEDAPPTFKRIRDVISKMFDRPGSGDEDTGAPQFLDSSDAEAERDGQGEWWDDTATDVRHELTQAPDSDPDPTDGEAEPQPAPQSAKEAREQKKAAAAEQAAAAKAEKQKQLEQKRAEKIEARSEARRQAQVRKEQKELARARLREEADEEKIAEDEARTRSRREKKANGEWKRKQKRREAIRLNGGKEGFWQGTSAPKPIEIANAIRSLAIILETSPAEIDAIKMMAEEFSGNRIGDAFDRIYDRLVKDNLTLVDAFAPEELFPSVVHNMLKVGAKTAKPGAALRSAVDLMDSGNDNKRKMRNAIREPAILAVASLAILFGTAWGVMPVFLEMYEAMELEIGAITAFVLVFADVSMWAIGILGVLAIGVTIWWFSTGRSSLRVRIAIDRWKLHAPLIGKGEQAGEVFQMFNIIDAYLSVGSTERETLLNTAGAMENRAIRRHLRSVANGLTRGEKTFAEFLDDEMFPKMARSILGTGQRSGQTLQVVKNLRTIYENESAIEGAQSVEKVVGLVSALSSILFTVTATIVTIPPLEIFGSTLSYRG